MVYVRVILAWLLPTLGLVAAGQYGFEPVRLIPANGVQTFLSPSDQGRQGREFDTRAFDPSNRLQNRRFGPHFGSGGPPAIALPFDSQIFALDAEPFGPSGSEATLILARGWQFLLRTALEPRAPSLVS